MSKTEAHSDSSRQRTGRQLPPQQLARVLQSAKRRSWLEMAWQFPRERDGMASFLALEAAEVLAGCKPANLVRLANRLQPCGRNLYTLWARFGTQLIADSALEICCCRKNETEILLLIYRPDLLQRRLAGRTAIRFLQRCGYPDCDLEPALAELQRRFGEQAVPHEIGLFLGYPLKDVAAFIGWSDTPFTCQRGWKIFGNPRRSLALADRYGDCRSRMSARLGQGAQPEQLLRLRAGAFR